MPDLAADVSICLARDTVPLIGTLGEDGALRRWSAPLGSRVVR